MDWIKDMQQRTEGVLKNYAVKESTPGTVEYGAKHGMTPTEWSEQVSKIKSASAYASNRAIQGLVNTGGGYADPNAIAAIQASIGAAETSGMAGLEGLNRRIMEENVKYLAERKAQRERDMWSNVLGIAGLLIPGWGGKAAQAAGMLTGTGGEFTPSLGGMDVVPTDNAYLEAAGQLNITPENLARLMGKSTTGIQEYQGVSSTYPYDPLEAQHRMGDYKGGY